MEVKRFLESRIRGWFPQEPIQRSHSSINTKLLSKAEFDKKIFKASLIANAIMLNVFLGTNFFLVRPLYESLGTSILQWSILVPTVIVVNVLIYRHYKRRLLPKGWF